MDSKYNMILNNVPNFLDSIKENEIVCEWTYVSSVTYIAKISCTNKERNIKSMRYYNYCPYCGRKIKIIQ